MNPFREWDLRDIQTLGLATREEFTGIPVKSQISPVFPTAHSWSLQVWMEIVPQGSWIKDLAAPWGAFVERLDKEDWNLIGRLSYWSSDLKASRNCEGPAEKDETEEGMGKGGRMHDTPTQALHTGMHGLHSCYHGLPHPQPAAKTSVNHTL